MFKVFYNIGLDWPAKLLIHLRGQVVFSDKLLGEGIWVRVRIDSKQVLVVADGDLHVKACGLADWHTTTDILLIVAILGFKWLHIGTLCVCQCAEIARVQEVEFLMELILEGSANLLGSGGDDGLLGASEVDRMHLWCEKHLVMVSFIFDIISVLVNLESFSLAMSLLVKLIPFVATWARDTTLLELAVRLALAGESSRLECTFTVLRVVDVLLSLFMLTLLLILLAAIN